MNTPDNKAMNTPDNDSGGLTVGYTANLADGDLIVTNTGDVTLGNITLTGTHDLAATATGPGSIAVTGGVGTPLGDIVLCSANAILGCGTMNAGNAASLTAGLGIGSCANPLKVATTHLSASSGDSFTSPCARAW